MTLTALLPTLRHSIPSPFDRDAWPAGSVPTIDDVVISGVSLLRFAELCGTPSACTGAAVIPMSGGASSATEGTTVVVASIAATDAAGIRLDGRFGHLDAHWREARLIGRVSNAYEKSFDVYDATLREKVGELRIPGDPRVGDLIAVPCRGWHVVGDVRPDGR